MRNEGPVDVDEYTLHVDFVADDEWMHTIAPFTDGATWYEDTFTGGITALTEQHLWSWSPYGEITAQDVERGYVYAIASVKWVDPDSGKDRVAYSSPLYLPVISQTGLLLQKGIAHGPVNGQYFQQDEAIDWTLTATNTSQEVIRNVTVYDQGQVVGQFAEIAPGNTVTCTVPPHIVTQS